MEYMIYHNIFIDRGMSKSDLVYLLARQRLRGFSLIDIIYQTYAANRIRIFGIGKINFRNVRQ